MRYERDERFGNLSAIGYDVTSSTTNSSRKEADYRQEGGKGHRVYTYGTLSRVSAYGLLLSVPGAGAFLIWKSVSGTDSADLIAIWCLFALLVLNAWQVSSKSLSAIRLADDCLFLEHLLQSDRKVCLAEIHRMVIGGVAVKIYTSPGRDPDLVFQRSLKDGDDLIKRLMRVLPESTEIENLSGIGKSENVN